MHRTPQLSLDLDGRPGTVRTARREVERFLDRLALGPDARVDVGLVVGELVANACLHAPGPCRLTVRVGAGRVDVAVRDHSPRLPAARAGGYGLLVVDRLCAQIRALRVTDGKVVRATVLRR